MRLLKTDHAYQPCRDPDCSEFPCRVFKEGHGAGFQAGFDAGFGDGYVEGASDASEE